MNIAYWKHNKSNQFDQISKISRIHLSQLMTSAHFRSVFLKNIPRQILGKVTKFHGNWISLQFISTKCLKPVRGHSKSTSALRRGEGRGYSKRIPKCRRGGESWKIVSAPIIFLKRRFLFWLFLFFDSLIGKWKLWHLEKLTVLLNIDRVFHIAFHLIPQNIWITTSKNTIWL